jgi:hypothetical protein
MAGIIRFYKKNSEGTHFRPLTTELPEYVLFARYKKRESHKVV